VRASGGGKDTPLLVVGVASKQKEGEKLKKFCRRKAKNLRSRRKAKN
jgi:hypothetical protein